MLTRHGFPDIQGDPYPVLAKAVLRNLKTGNRKSHRGNQYPCRVRDTDFAGDDDDPKKKRLASFEALELGLEDGYDNIIFKMVDFTSENTDTIFAMRS